MKRGAKMAVVAGLLAMASVSIAEIARAQNRSSESAQMWLTLGDRSKLLEQVASPLPFSAAAPGAAAANAITVDVNDMARFQTVDGFGVALTGGSAQLLMKMDAASRSALLKELFGRDGNGIGTSYLRLSVGASDMNDHVFSYDDLADGDTDVDMKKFDLGQDKQDVIPVMKEILAIAPNIKILASPWSAPAWMKTNGKVKGGELKPEYYQAFANYLTKYVQAMAKEGIVIDAITVENEPLNPKNTPSMVVFADEEGAFIGKALGPTFAKNGVKTKILLYDHNPDVTSYALSILADPQASQYVDGTAFHLYGGDASGFDVVHDAFPNKNLYMTEQSVNSRPNGPFGIAAAEARVPIASMRNWSRNVLFWNLAADPQNGPHTNDGGCTGCSGAITIDGNKVTRNLAYYALAHFSKFVAPGSVRIASSESEQLATVAFATPEGRVVLVAANVGNFDKTFSVRYHGRAFTTTLSSEAVATYVW